MTAQVSWSAHACARRAPPTSKRFAVLTRLEGGWYGLRRRPGAGVAPVAGRRLGALRRAERHVASRLGRDHRVDRLPRSDDDRPGSAPGGHAQRGGAAGRSPGGRRPRQRRPAGRRARRRPRDPADVAGRRGVLEGRPRTRAGRHPPGRRGERRTLAAGRQSLWREGQVGRDRHRDRRTACVAVGVPDRQADQAGRDHVGVVGHRHRHRSAPGHQAAARERRDGRRRPLGRGAVPAGRRPRTRGRRPRDQHRRLGRPPDRRAGVPRSGADRDVQLGVPGSPRDGGRTARDGHAPVRHAGRRRRQRRVPGQPRRVGDGHPSRKTLGLNAIGRRRTWTGCSTTC